MPYSISLILTNFVVESESTLSIRAKFGPRPACTSGLIRIPGEPNYNS